MAFPRKLPGLWIKSGFWIALAAMSVPSRALPESANRPEQPIVHQLSGKFPEKPSIPPSWTVPVEPLGFSAPGSNYLGARNALASLDFLGENRLLFTFRVPGLMRREAGRESENQRQIRAVVISLPSGAVQAETNWTVHDRSRYLVPLDDNHFLIRDGRTIYESDAELNRKPLLQFPGPLISVQLSPGRQYIVTNSSEPRQMAAAIAGNDTATATTGDTSDLILRILDRDSHKVLLVTHVRNPVLLPLNSDGFLNAEHGSGNEWNVDMNYFSGPNRVLSKIKSTCAPDLDFLSDNVALATACSDSGDNALVGFTTAGTTLWTDLVTERQVWPLLTINRGGSRFARETLYVSHPIGTFDPLGSDDIKGQWVQVIDTATGNLAFEGPASPILDAGGNVAISPSGRRVAVVNGTSIEVFELPPPPEMPGPIEPHASR